MLFDRHGVIRRYETPEDILADFFELRMEYYGRRRAALIQARTPFLLSSFSIRMLLNTPSNFWPYCPFNFWPSSASSCLMLP